MKIKKIIIKNFQSHSYSELEFSEGLNCILGASDTGKSAILRSLECVLFRGKFYMRHNETEAMIRIEMTDVNLSRFRSIKPNNTSEKYLLDSTVFRKIGKHLPEEITNATRIKPIELNDGSLLNLQFQTQHSGKFLLDDSEYGEAYRARVTSLAGSELLDKASQEAAKEHRKVKSDLNLAVDSELHETNESLSKLDSIPTDLESLRNLKILKEKIDATNKKLEYLSDAQSKLKELFEFEVKDYSTVLTMINIIIWNLKVIQLAKKHLEVNKSIFIPNEIPSLDNITKIVGTLNKLNSLQKVNADLYWTVCMNSDSLVQKSIITNEFDEFKQSIKSCPLCNGGLK